MPRCACASEVYGRVFVYMYVSVCVSVDCYSCSRINEVQVRVSIGFYSHVFLCEEKLVHVYTVATLLSS